MRAGRPPAYSISPFMRDTKLVKGIHCEVREQVFDIAIEDTPVRAFYMTMSYHYKFPRALESKFKQQTEGNFAKFVLLYLDVEDKNRQFVEVQKLALVYGYNLLPADSVEDCRDCLEELRVEFTGESKQTRKPERPTNSQDRTDSQNPSEGGSKFYPKDRPEQRSEQ